MKKNIFRLLFIIVLLVQALPTHAGINALGFNFETTFTSAGKTYYVDIAKASSITKGSDGMTNGTYDLRAYVGFYGDKADIESDDFIENVFFAMQTKVKKSGSTTYLGELETQSSMSSVSIANYSGRIAYYELLSHAGFGYVDPGNYTIDVLLNNQIIKSTTICLPTFTSSIGKSIGNVTCTGTSAATPTPSPASTPQPTPSEPAAAPTTPPDASADATPATTDQPGENTPAATPTNSVEVKNDQFSSGVSDACSGGDCYSLFSGFADAVGSKFSAIKDADSLGGLVNAIIAFGIGLGGVLAVAMIMYQGFLYMKSDNVSTLTSIKGKIINTILGFLLLLTIYTLLRTINPDLLNVNVSLDKITLTVADGQDTNEALDTAIQTNPEVAKIYSTSKGHWRDGGRVNPNTESARRSLASQVPQSDLASIDNGEVAIKPGAGKFVHKSVAPKIIAMNRALKQQEVYITVTEAFKPTTYMHYAACQYTSTCIDAAIPFNAKKIAQFVAEGQKQGLVVVWETKSQNNYTALIKQGVPKSNVLLFNGHITGDHASVYDYQ